MFRGGLLWLIAFPFRSSSFFFYSDTFPDPVAVTTGLGASAGGRSAATFMASPSSEISLRYISSVN